MRLRSAQRRTDDAVRGDPRGAAEVPASGLMARLPSLDEWSAMVAPYLEFLVEKGFRALLVRDEPNLAAWGPRVRYVDSMVGVELHCSLEFDCVDTSIIRLVDGELPAYPIFINDGDDIRWFHLDGLLGIVDPQRSRDPAARGGLDRDSLERQLAFIASALKDLADDLLDPSAPPFAARQRQVHEQVRADPPKVTIHVPAEATTDEIDELVERSKESYPDVGVEVHRYER